MLPVETRLAKIREVISDLEKRLGKEDVSRTSRGRLDESDTTLTIIDKECMTAASAIRIALRRVRLLLDLK